MHSFTVWKNAADPNYKTNIDQDFPYSDLPHQGEYKLLKIPVSLNDLIKHVDYFGEGRVESRAGIRGFPNCYNVNHQYRLVSSGPDKGKKIPNRIPVPDYSNCDTSAYIKDNSVVTVTVASSYLNSSCARDIARVVNTDLGKVVVYDLKDHTQDISELARELRAKGMFPYVNEPLPNELQGLTYFVKPCEAIHVVFSNKYDIRALKVELCSDIIAGNYDSAVNISKSIVVSTSGEDLNVIVQKFISEVPRNVMVYACKLWHGDAKDIVRLHFPKWFQHIFNKDAVTIVNKYYGQALRLDSNQSDNERDIWGDNRLPITSSRLSWKLFPSCKGNDLTFELYNIDCDMFIKMSDEAVSGDKVCRGSMKTAKDTDDDRFKFYLDPVIVSDADPAFLITNVHQKQELKLELKRNNAGDGLLWGDHLKGLTTPKARSLSDCVREKEMHDNTNYNKYEVILDLLKIY